MRDGCMIGHTAACVMSPGRRVTSVWCGLSSLAPLWPADAAQHQVGVASHPLWKEDKETLLAIHHRDTGLYCFLFHFQSLISTRILLVYDVFYSTVSFFFFHSNIPFLVFCKFMISFRSFISAECFSFVVVYRFCYDLMAILRIMTLVRKLTRRDVIWNT